MTRKPIIGIIDYGVGNLASVQQAFMKIGFRSRVSDSIKELASSNALILPGVGAFPPAMAVLENKNLDNFIKEESKRGKFILGICLGMQLLTESSLENGNTTGLGLIPGKVVPLGQGKYHIGWNDVKSITADPIANWAEDKLFYFNHSYMYEGDEQFKIGVSCVETSFASIIRHDNAIGVQFHPEKSQRMGHMFLQQVMKEIINA